MGTGPYFLISSRFVLPRLAYLIFHVCRCFADQGIAAPLRTSSPHGSVLCRLTFCLVSGYRSMFSNLLLLLVPTALPCDLNVLERSRKHPYYKVVVLSSRFDFKSNLLSLYLQSALNQVSLPPFLSFPSRSTSAIRLEASRVS